MRAYGHVRLCKAGRVTLLFLRPFGSYNNLLNRGGVVDEHRGVGIGRDLHTTALSCQRDVFGGP